MTTRQTFSSRDDDIDLRAILGTLLDHKWLIIAVTAAFAIASVLYAVLATPVYRATAVVQVEPKTPSLPGLQDLSQTLGTSTSQAVTEIALLTSRSTVGQAVQNLGLDIDVKPEHFPLFGAFMARRFSPTRPGEVAAPVAGMNRYDWGGSQLEIFQLDVPPSLLDQPLHVVAGEHGNYVLTDDDGNTLLSGRVGQPESASGITMQVQAMQANPGMRFDVVRHASLVLIGRLQANLVAAEQGKDSGIIRVTYDNSDPQRATRFLDQVTALYVRQNVDRNSAEAANSLKFVRDQLPRVRLELEQATKALNAFQTQAHSVDITLQTKGVLDQIVSIESSLQQLRMQMSDMQQRFTPQHPAYKALQQQIGQLEAKRDTLQKQVGKLPDIQQQLLRLTRDVQVSNQTYTSLLNQAQQLDIARAGTVGNVRVIDRAATDVTQPVWPQRVLVVLAGTVLGGVLAVGFVFLRQMLNRGIEDPAAIERLGLPVYVSIPHSELMPAAVPRSRQRRLGAKQNLLALRAPDDIATEALRSLRTSLHFARMEAKNNLLMISSASPGAGKSFVAGNLGVVVAQAGQRVLLIDADMRKGTLHNAVGGRPEEGLSELISGQIDLPHAVRNVDGAGKLFFIARGKVPPNPSELLMHANFSALLEKLKSRFDLIIIDTPPILAVTDAAVIGHHVGTSLMVVRFGVNQAREIALARQRFEQNGVPIKGAIFNAVEKRSAGYYTYAYYAYGSTPAEVPLGA
ncbi:polysaccharide biosynthesis tyrosine autokinase [Dyella sp.]|jgi:tyrosine-protein kinase Etk/Wzc|uniref:polysaccharide biosynthesis tyrosine autokinase n=1 Tax=Dyella sp. TaxID=1869338 RepID=UPI002D79CFEF|nr:polysaccharide biosynthesis tyrosine autokinase [Dyella sp.]HET6431602.1 polysaccharide biosynthesis tyrosine autokinase [Dyella sp.]